MRDLGHAAPRRVHRHRLDAIDRSFRTHWRARREWNLTETIDGTATDLYLLSLRLGSSVPSSIRHGIVPRFWDASGHEGPRAPAMIAAAQDVTGRVCGIERTFLDEHGRKARRGEPPLTLGRVRGAALRLPDGECWTLVRAGVHERSTRFWRFGELAHSRPWNRRKWVRHR